MNISTSLQLLETKSLSSFLEDLAFELDISDTDYEEATVKYEQVGLWLAEEGQTLADYSPQIYAQGSFRLGTVVKPANQYCEYDIDLVCLLDLAKDATSQRDLKGMVGKRLSEHEEFGKKLSASRRCWNLRFPNQFHMDVLPSIKNSEQPPDGILLTDTELVRWQKSNPVAYSEWFHIAMAAQFGKRRAERAEILKASIEDVPEWRVKTPLQRSVQLLKRHRDMTFRDDQENRPVSIIVTTLAARAYRNEPLLADALLGIAARMPNSIENRGGKWWVPNPVEPDENFADKWNEKPERKDAFVSWLAQIRQDIEQVLKGQTMQKAVDVLSPRFGQSASTAARTRFASRFGSLTLTPVVAPPTPLPTVISPTTHCLPVRWPMNAQSKVSVDATLHYRKNGPKMGHLSGRKLPKKIWIKFAVKTNASWPYTIHWQVVNTGPEAASAHQLRGDFYSSDTGSIRWETTAYSGVHWVEAFVVKNDICIARSGRRYVSVN